MSVERAFTIASFYDFLKENQLMAAKCVDCGTVLLPPKPMCTKCFSLNLEWIEHEKTGTLLSYSVIHVAPKQFESMVPYIVGIVKFENGRCLPGIIRNISVEQIKVGIKVKLYFESSVSSNWPTWRRYFFTPI